MAKKQQPSSITVSSRKTKSMTTSPNGKICKNETTSSSNDDETMDDETMDEDSMCASSNASSSKFGRINRLVLDKNSEEYRKKRERNNLAVKKSRNKSKLKTQQTMQRVEELRAENEKLETKVKLLSKELSFLKDLFLAHAGSVHGQIDLQQQLSNGSQSSIIAINNNNDNNNETNNHIIAGLRSRQQSKHK